ncbi:MAG: membrane-bound lytic murein transglycosylase D [Saprospiraceae bacterium]|jgi:membrane-bound lytic murein transglycosylase D
MFKKKSVYIVLIMFAVVFELFVYSTKGELTEGVVTHDKYKISSFELNYDIDFCGEKVPLHSQDILERYEHEILKNAHWHSEMILMYKRSGKFFPMIERILKENGIPDDFKYLCVIESGLANVVSPVGASGFWQIMEKTGQEYGLEINRNVDERYHLEKATKVACKYFKRAYKKFGSWTLVAASYNMGISGVARRLKKQQVSSYYDLLINRETSRYVFRVLAVKQILTNPEKFNFSFSGTKKYEQVPLRYASVDSSISDLIDWSLNESINYKILKIFNPWLKTTRLPNKDSAIYEIAIPTGGVFSFSTDSVDSIALTFTQDSVVIKESAPSTSSSVENE